jgi:diguanylate cyclase
MSIDQARDSWGDHQKAVALMKQYDVIPTSEHYSVWFRHVTGVDAELSQVINQRMQDRIPFDAAFSGYLYRHYVLKHEYQAAHSKGIGATHETMHAMLEFIRTTLAGASEGTAGVHKKLDALLHSDHTDVHAMMRAVVDVAQDMKHSADELRKHLRDSQHQIDALKHNLETISLESQRDFLTNVYNRKALDTKTMQLISECKEQDVPLSMLVIDVDHFKKFNDTHGHLIGDEVLKMIARILLDMVKGQDVVGRFGGEEFVVVLPSTSIGGAMVVAEHIRKTTAKKELRHRTTGESFGVVTVSIGVAQYRHESDQLSSWFARADDALYRSKHAGRNRVTQEDITLAPTTANVRR